MKINESLCLQFRPLSRSHGFNIVLLLSLLQNVTYFRLFTCINVDCNSCAQCCVYPKSTLQSVYRLFFLDFSFLICKSKKSVSVSIESRVSHALQLGMKLKCFFLEITFLQPVPRISENLPDWSRSNFAHDLSTWVVIDSSLASSENLFSTHRYLQSFKVGKKFQKSI